MKYKISQMTSIAMIIDKNSSKSYPETNCSLVVAPTTVHRMCDIDFSEYVYGLTPATTRLSRFCSDSMWRRQLCRYRTIPADDILYDSANPCVDSSCWSCRHWQLLERIRFFGVASWVGRTASRIVDTTWKYSVSPHGMAVLLQTRCKAYGRWLGTSTERLKTLTSALQAQNEYWRVCKRLRWIKCTRHNKFFVMV